MKLLSRSRQLILKNLKLLLEANRHYGFIFVVTKKLIPVPDKHQVSAFSCENYCMFWKKMKSFSKNVSCPSSPKLLAFQKGDVLLNEGITIQRHLVNCDFCAAEVEFYEHFPPIEDKIETTEMPKPLRELAEALLGNRCKDFSVLDKLMLENEGFSLGKV